MSNKPKFHYEISFPDFEPSEDLKLYVEKYLAKLEKVFDRIISCHVAIRAPHMRKNKHIYHVNIHLEIPGKDIIVNHEPEKNMDHSSVHLAIRDSFKALHRQLRKRAKSMQEKKPPQDNHQQAIIKSFDPNQGYGFLEDPMGREIYFHKNSVINGDLSKLKRGIKVRFLEESGQKGSQVTSMSILG